MDKLQCRCRNITLCSPNLNLANQLTMWSKVTISFQARWVSLHFPKLSRVIWYKNIIMSQWIRLKAGNNRHVSCVNFLFYSCENMWNICYKCSVTMEKAGRSHGVSVTDSVMLHEPILTWSRWMQSQSRGKIVELIFSRGIKQQRCNGINSKYITLATSAGPVQTCGITLLDECLSTYKKKTIPASKWTADFYRGGGRSWCQHMVCFIVFSYCMFATSTVQGDSNAPCNSFCWLMLFPWMLFLLHVPKVWQGQTLFSFTNSLQAEHSVGRLGK